MGEKRSGAVAAASPVYGVGVLGAWVWFWQQADGFWWHVWAVVEGLLWPAYMVYEGFRFLD